MAREVLNIGARHVPVVIADLSSKRRSRPPPCSPGAIATACRWTSGTSPTRPATTLFIGKNSIDFEIPGTLGIIQEHAVWLKDRNKERHYPFIAP
jgi:(E)-4-hydroxy-3-methylbut-2-enyl-diphosphate synthase